MPIDPIVPPQDAAPVATAPTSLFAAYPEGSFLESVAIGGADEIFITSHVSGEIFRLDAEGRSALWVKLERPATGLAFAQDGSLFVTGGQPHQAPGSIWRIEGMGQAKHWLDIPDASFLNGMTSGPDGRLLAVDSLNGKIYAINPDAPGHSLWFADDRLKARSPESIFPGANGIKRRGDAIYVSNTDRAQMQRIDVDSRGAPTGLAVVAERLLVDDFAFDRDGAAYCASHAYNLLIKLTPTGERLALAGVAEGVVNPTAVAFGAGPNDRDCVYVTTTGGMAAPVDGKLQVARVLKVKVGAIGAALIQA